MSKAVAFGLALLAFGFDGPAGRARAADQVAGLPEATEFAGKYLAISYRSGPEHNAGLFKGVSLKKLADRTFLVGESVNFVRVDDKDKNKDEDEDWRGAASWIPLDQVDHIVIFKDLAKATRIARRSREEAQAAAAAGAIPPMPVPVERPAPELPPGLRMPRFGQPSAPAPVPAPAVVPTPAPSLETPGVR